MIQAVHLGGHSDLLRLSARRAFGAWSTRGTANYCHPTQLVFTCGTAGNPASGREEFRLPIGFLAHSACVTGASAEGIGFYPCKLDLQAGFCDTFDLGACWQKAAVRSGRRRDHCLFLVNTTSSNRHWSSGIDNRTKPNRLPDLELQSVRRRSVAAGAGWVMMRDQQQQQPKQLAERPST